MRRYLEATSAFFNFQHELRAIYSTMIGTDFKDATIEEWIWLCRRVGAVGLCTLESS